MKKTSKGSSFCNISNFHYGFVWNPSKVQRSLFEQIARFLFNLLIVVLKSHRIYSTLKRLFHVVSTWKARGVFTGRSLKLVPKSTRKKNFSQPILTQCSISIPLDNVIKPLVSGGTEMEYWTKWVKNLEMRDVVCEI